MKALAKQIATAVSLLKGPEPPTALGPQLVKKKKDAIERAVRESQSILLEEDNGERFDAK
jgi:ABC-type branched-subunit amino acid transport system ATPase component